MVGVANWQEKGANWQFRYLSYFKLFDFLSFREKCYHGHTWRRGVPVPEVPAVTTQIRIREALLSGENVVPGW